MKKLNILHLSSNEYVSWLTYCSEYINEAFEHRLDVEFKVWGKYRPGFEAGLNGAQVVKKLYTGTLPDAIIVDSSMAQSADPEIRCLIDGLEQLREKTLLIWRTADPWRFVASHRAHAERIKPQIWLSHFDFFTEQLNEQLPQGCRAYTFPFAIGRRYFNLRLDRKYDLGLIGRCEHAGKPLNRWKFGLKNRVLAVPPLSKFRQMKPRKYIDHVMDLVMNLNQCRFSWNSPVKPKATPQFLIGLRFVEAPACGAVSLVSFPTDELTRFYFPKDAFVDSEQSLERAKEILAESRSAPEKYRRIAARAYQVVMANHQMDNRVEFLLALIRGNAGANARDFYKIKL